MSQKTVTINGVEYDAQTGLRLTGHKDEAKTPKKRASAATSSNVHAKAQRTKTLKRSHVKSPAKKSKAPAARPSAGKPKASAAVHRSPMISRFASHDVTPARKKPVAAAPAKKDTPTPTHPVHHAAKAAVAKKQAVHAPAPAREVKKKAVEKAMKHPTHKAKKQSIFQRHPRLFSLATVGLVVVLLAGYVTYVNLPYISVKIASVQAGVNANYPTYQPSGYRLAEPVQFTDGTVTIKFTSNSSSESFTIAQTESGWDSASLYENYVAPRAYDDYITLNDGGLTIYRWDNDAAWVNGGIRYILEGDAQLSDSQVQRIARSM